MTSQLTQTKEFIKLPTTSPTSLLEYLKAVGLMAITGEKGYWEQDQFKLNMESAEQLVQFFIGEYEPKPIANPWNKDSGFLSGNKLSPFLTSQAERYKRIKQNYQNILEILSENVDIKQHNSKELKSILFPLLENKIKDEAFADWLASVGTVTTYQGQETVQLNSLLGNGGNVSRNDLAFNYLDCCRQLWELDTGNPTPECQTFAEAAIAGIAHQKSLVKKGILCHLSPRNDYFGELDTSSGSEDYPDNGVSTQLANPVDYVLAIEGLLQFSGTVKTLKTERSYALYPLLLDMNAGSAQTSDRTENNKHECWLPLWSQPMDVEQYRLDVSNYLQYRLNNQIKSTLDLLEELSNASQHLNFNRYSRFGFWPRKGRGDYAIHIGIETPKGNDIGAELRTWRHSVRPRPSQTNATYNILMALEQRLVALQRGQGSYQELLILLGQVERHLSKLQSAYLRPVPLLSENWVRIAYLAHPCVEFRLAAALASTEFRAQISSARYNPKKGRFFWSNNRDVVPTYSLSTLTFALLRKWSQDLAHHPSQRSLLNTTLTDIEQLTQGSVNESLIIDLACGLALCNLPTELWAHQDPTFLPFSYRYAAYAHWHPDYSLSMPAIYGLHCGSTVPLVRSLRAQGIPNRLPHQIGNGAAITQALTFPVDPLYLGVL